MKTKNFDCVKMKHEIQRKLLKETKGLTPEERRQRTKEKIMSNPILGPYLEKVRQQKNDEL